MFGIFMESLVILKLYTGLKLLLVLTLISWSYLFLTEKRASVRVLFVYAPVLIILLFLCPVSRKVFVAAGLDGETYYRILWTIPFGMVTAYGAVKASLKHKLIGLALSVLLIGFCGKYVYQSTYITKAENAYHVPETVVELCELIHPKEADEHVQVMVVVPEEMGHFIRQVDSDIHMPYGREMIASQWNYYNAVYEAMEGGETIDLEKLIAACREEYCQYIVLSDARVVEGDPLELGLVEIARLDGYRVYLDPVSQEMAESFAKYYTNEG